MPSNADFNIRSAGSGTDDVDNGIPLCFDCHAEVESYNNNHPRGRKYTPTELKRHRDGWFELVASGNVLQGSISKDQDVEFIRFYSQCLDRPAFQDLFMIEGSFEAFDKAIEDTITAINTGCLRSRDGTILATAKGKSYLSDPDLREILDVIVDLLRSIRSRYLLAVKNGQIYLNSEDNGLEFYCFHDHEIANWMDAERFEVIKVFSDACKKVNIPHLRFPRGRGRRPGF